MEDVFACFFASIIILFVITSPIIAIIMITFFVKKRRREVHVDTKNHVVNEYEDKYGKSLFFEPFKGKLKKGENIINADYVTIHPDAIIFFNNAQKSFQVEIKKVYKARIIVNKYKWPKRSGGWGKTTRHEIIIYPDYLHIFIYSYFNSAVYINNMSLFTKEGQALLANKLVGFLKEKGIEIEEEKNKILTQRGFPYVI